MAWTLTLLGIASRRTGRKTQRRVCGEDAANHQTSPEEREQPRCPGAAGPVDRQRATPTAKSTLSTPATMKLVT